MKDDIMLHYSYVFENWVQNENRRKLFARTPPDCSEGFYCRFDDFSFSMQKGESVVLLDSDSRIITSLFDLLESGARIPPSAVRVNGGAWKAESPSCTLIPSRPTASMLFPQLSVLDNLCFTLDHKIRNFWLTDKKKEAIAQDLYPIFGDSIYASSLYGLDERLLYDIVYQRILLQHPSFVCVMQPLASVDMLMRLHLLAYFDKFREKGMTVCILAFALSDSLEIANRLLVIKDGRIDSEYQRSDFPSYPGISGSRPGDT
jgi:ribose transport system ATP-binding protein